jgi:AraC-like DNA-binding protein
MGRPRKPLVLNSAETAQLRSMAHSPSLSHSLVRRARIVLMSAEGASNRVIAAHCGVSIPTINLWRRRWCEGGIAALHGKPRPGRPPAYGHHAVVALIRRVLHDNRRTPSRCTVRAVAAQTGLSKSTVARYFAMFGLKQGLHRRGRHGQLRQPESSLDSSRM